LAAGFALGIALGGGTGEALFLGVALVATSVGITARVLADRGLLDSEVARVILGAAVIDDVLGLLVLAIAKGVAEQGTLALAEFGLILLLALSFVAAALLLGPRLVRTAVRRAGALRDEDAPTGREREHVTVLAIAVCLGLSALAAVMGLAALVGAFFAGMAFAEYRQLLPAGACDAAAGAAAGACVLRLHRLAARPRRGLERGGLGPWRDGGGGGHETDPLRPGRASARPLAILRRRRGHGAPRRGRHRRRPRRPQRRRGRTTALRRGGHHGHPHHAAEPAAARGHAATHAAVPPADPMA
jgi:hypothetical protein